MPNKIVIIGGAGNMARITAKFLLGMLNNYRIVLAGRNEERVKKIAASFHSEQVEACCADALDKDGLQKVIAGASLVLNATGPLVKTGLPVLRACIEEKVHYFDYGDSYSAAQSMFSIDKEARDACITALICAGLAPGLLSVIAKKCIQMLDKTDLVEFAVVMGGASGSTATQEDIEKGIEQMLIKSTGTCVLVENGIKIEVPAFRRRKIFKMPEPIGRYACYLLDLAEVSTFSHFYPNLSNIAVYAGLRPPYLMGVFQGIAQKIEKRKLSWKEAVDFLAGKKTQTTRGYWAALSGILSQLLRGDMGIADLTRLLHITHHPEDTKGGIFIYLEGEHHGKRAKISYSEVENLETVDEGSGTGMAMAAFIQLFLAGKIKGCGVLSPEACVEPDELFELVEKLGLTGLKKRLSDLQIEYFTP